MKREILHSKILEELKSKAQVHLIFEGGSKAFNRYDEFSDIDMMVGVEDHTGEETLHQIEIFLERLTGIDASYIAAADPRCFHRFYKLRDTHPYHIIDLYIMERSAPNKPFEKEIHGEPVIFLDKDNDLQNVPLDRRAFDDKVSLHYDKMKQTFLFFHFLAEKELQRNRYLDAMGFYLEFTLKPLVSLLRTKYNPAHYNFGLRYLYDEFPASVVQELEALYSVSDRSDLLKKHGRALELFQKEIQ